MTDASPHWKRLRLKPDPTISDIDWRGTITSPNQLQALVGGTADDGDYEIYLQGFVLLPGGRQVDIDATISATRAAAETSAQMATALDTAFDTTPVSDSSSVLLSAVGFNSTVSSATVTIHPPAGFYGTISSAAPGTATITHPIGTTAPICAASPLFARGGTSSPNGVTVMVNCMDDAGETLLAPSTATFTLTAIELAIVERVDANGTKVYEERYGATAAVASCTPGTPYELPLRGAKYWTVRITTGANLPAGTDSLEVIWRDSAT
jgi:hypothetical protein